MIGLGFDNQTISPKQNTNEQILHRAHRQTDKLTKHISTKPEHFTGKQRKENIPKIRRKYLKCVRQTKRALWM